MDNALRVSVFGAGYVGLVTAAGLAAIGHHVLCVDVDEKKIASLTSGEVPFFEPGLPEMIARGVASQHLRFTSSVNLAIDHGQVIIIGVGTPPLRVVLQTFRRCCLWPLQLESRFRVEQLSW